MFLLCTNTGFPYRGTIEAEDFLFYIASYGDIIKLIDNKKVLSCDLREIIDWDYVIEIIEIKEE